MRLDERKPAHLVSEGAGRYRVEGEMVFVTVMDLLRAGEEAFAAEERIRLDLGGVTRFNMAGLALVVEWLRFARRESKSLVISNPPHALMALADICETDGILKPVLVGSSGD